MPATPALKFRIRISKGDDIAVGPGKIALLEAIIDTGSITAAAKHLGMSYRRAWLLVDAMNHAFASPVAETAKGGPLGGRTVITPLGEEVIRRYRTIEAIAGSAARAEIASLLKLLRA
ncbi:MAG: winged helix-turn-helix domain-containing protein [Burkholderiales bacterium]|nr:winged helix-turn-helix domain-containing protein [Burkholderiales bacterium]